MDQAWTVYASLWPSTQWLMFVMFVIYHWPRNVDKHTSRLILSIQMAEKNSPHTGSSYDLTPIAPYITILPTFLTNKLKNDDVPKLTSSPFPTPHFQGFSGPFKHLCAVPLYLILIPVNVIIKVTNPPKAQPIHQKRLLKENDVSCTSFLQLKKETNGWIFYEVQKNNGHLCKWVCVFLFKFPPGWLSQFEFRTHGFAGFVGRLLLIQPSLKAHLYNPLPLKKRSPTKITNQPNSLPCQSRIGEGYCQFVWCFFVVRALWQQDSPSCHNFESLYFTLL